MARWIRALVVLLLAAAIFNASTQAKLCLYDPPGSASLINAKITKLRECRLEQLSPEAPAEAVEPGNLMPLVAEDTTPFVPTPIEVPRVIPIPRAHDSRPPPFTS